MTSEKTKKKGILRILTIILLGGGILGYTMYNDYQIQQLIDEGLRSPEPTLPAIELKAFEELPVGVIYEVPKELQEQYIKAAKAKYEMYGYLGPQQKVFHGSGNMNNQLMEREDVVSRDNNVPSDMLNCDASLRYPDMFYGFIIHDENLEGLDSESTANKRYENYRKDNSISNIMNLILYVEDYYLNGGKVSKLHSTLENQFIADIAYAEYPCNPTLQMMKEAIKSGVIKSSKDENISKLLYQYMTFYDDGTFGADIYSSAISMMEIDNHYDGWGNYHYHEADGITIDNALKYDKAKECEGETPVFYYPVRVWKIDNNSIVVDIQVENGEHLQAYDIMEIFVKLAQSNLSDESKKYYAGDRIEYSSDKYVVYGRLFNSNITQGVFAEFGTQAINYLSLGCENIAEMPCSGRSFVPNEKAEQLLRDFYTELKDQIDQEKAPSTKKIMKSVAKKNEIPYKDALAIYGTYYLQTIRGINNSNVPW